jgi:uncharacterized membrane protein YdbT with pleckstrin-like domain
MKTHKGREWDEERRWVEKRKEKKKEQDSETQKGEEKEKKRGRYKEWQRQTKEKGAEVVIFNTRYYVFYLFQLMFLLCTVDSRIYYLLVVLNNDERYKIKSHYSRNIKTTRLS